MRIAVVSNNGRVHLAERVTVLNPSSKKNRSEKAKNKVPKEYPGMVRKLCDGQWVPDKRKVQKDVTCPICSKL